jgi:hypothetical protein
MMPISVCLFAINDFETVLFPWNSVHRTIHWYINNTDTSSCWNKGLLIFLNRIVEVGVQTGSTPHVGHLLAYCTCPGWVWGCRIWWNGDWQRKPKYSEKTCPSATLSTTNPTSPDLGANSGRRDGKPATNRLSYCTAKGLFNKGFRLRYYLVHTVDEKLCDRRMKLACPLH